MLFSLATYSPNDPSFNQVVGQGYKVQNAAGLVGAYFAGTLAEFFGLAGYLWALGFLAAGAGCFFRRLSPAWWRWFGFLLFGVCVIGGAESAWAKAHIALGNVTGGGFLGKILFDLARYYLRPTGALLVWLFTLITGVQLMAGLTWGLLFRRIYLFFKGVGYRYRERRVERRRQKKVKERTRAEKSAQAEKEQESSKRAVYHGPLFSDDREAEPVRAIAKPSAGPKASGVMRGPDTGPLPDLNLLDSFEEDLPAVDQEALQEQSKNLEACLADFGIQGEIQDVVPGPVVTMFEYKPAPGVKISRIASLSDDLALGLKAAAVRVEAPLPGRDTVGIEVPNRKRRTVFLREVMESGLFQDSKSLLTMALGKDIYGRAYVADLGRMPHLLVAGATGAGKSVCLNSILLSFLYKARPDEVKLLLVDPKRIELSGYAGLPHLVHPVVTDMLTAKSALEWAVYEMERRYEAMALLGVRNVEGFNQKLAGLGENRPEELQDLEPMPFLVVVIDEL
ncbi:MAG: DNA translocase FtsK 4TM domain-containing protein, partial [Thermodesulfobacteriota bacterium]|nr:DNA translocase FtsK 4TM domain-containing protein [Thermodesulfobacteriota bacterium]